MNNSNYIPPKKDKKKTPLEKAVQEGSGRFVRESFYSAKCCRKYISGYRYFVKGMFFTICTDSRYKILEEQPSGSVWAISTAM